MQSLHEDGRVFDPVNAFSESCFWEAQTTPYIRCWSRARKNVNDAVLKLYDQDPETSHVLMFTSGMNAISAIIDAYSRGAPKGSIVLHGSEMYSDVWYSMNYICGKKTESRFVDVRDDEAVLRRFRDDGDKLLLFIVEVCTNASGQIFNFDLIPQLQTLAPDCVIVVDNTWLSPVSCNPFKYGADLVVESTTKHVSGCDAIGGMVTGSRTVMEPLAQWSAFFGIHVSSEHCRALEAQMSTIHTRHATAASIALDIALWLQSQPELANRVLHPLLPSHPCHHRAIKFFNADLGPTVFLFHVSAPVDAVQEDLQGLTESGSTILSQTSYGAPSSRFDPWPTEGRSDEFEWEEEEEEEEEGECTGSKDGAGTWVRLSVGYEAGASSLRKDVERFIRRVKARVDGGSVSQVSRNVPVAAQAWPGERFGGLRDEYLVPKRWRRVQAGAP